MNICWLETKRSPHGERKDHPYKCLSMNLRNADVFSKEIFEKPFPIITDLNSLKKHWATNYDLIFLGFSTRYSEYLLDSEFLKANKNAVLVYVSTDYENVYSASLFYSNREFIQLANYEKIPPNQKQENKCWNKRIAFITVNLNSLITYKPTIKRMGGGGMIYYGQFRKDRIEYSRLLNDGEINFSTHSNNLKKFLNVGIKNPKFIKPLTWEKNLENLRLFDGSIYIEDVSTHENYNFLPNRFYEAINSNVAILPHASTKTSIERSGYTIPDEWFWTITPLEVKTNIPILNDWILYARNKALQEKTETIEKIRGFLKNVEKNKDGPRTCFKN